MITLKKIFRALKKISKWATPTTERIYEIWTERRNGGEKNWRENALEEVANLWKDWQEWNELTVIEID